VRRLVFKKIEGAQISYSFEDLFDLVRRLGQAQFELDHNVNSRLALENLLLDV